MAKDRRGDRRAEGAGGGGIRWWHPAVEIGCLFSAGSARRTEFRWSTHLLPSGGRRVVMVRSITTMLHRILIGAESGQF